MADCQAIGDVRMHKAGSEQKAWPTQILLHWKDGPTKENRKLIPAKMIRFICWTYKEVHLRDMSPSYCTNPE
ncbi:hypothetical protein E2562_007895, partial [Oryza meyeriana var. granulata]